MELAVFVGGYVSKMGDQIGYSSWQHFVPFEEMVIQLNSLCFRLITSDFAAATVLITFGAVLGKVSRLQLAIIGVFEIVFYALNEKILSHKLHITDVGGSMVIHAFGAYFGLVLARVINNAEIEEENEKEGSSYSSDLFAMIGRLISN